MKGFLRAAGIRALRTVAQAAAAVIGTSAVLSEIDWVTVASAAIMAGIRPMVVMKRPMFSKAPWPPSTMVP